MDWRIFPFYIAQNFRSLIDLKEEVSSNLEDCCDKFNEVVSLSDKDYSTTEKKSDKSAEIIHEFAHCIHGICNPIFLSDQILYFKFHSELEDTARGLMATHRRFDEHKTRFKIPPKFNKPFLVLFSNTANGFLLAPWGTPNRVEYIINNDLKDALPIIFKNEIKFSSQNMDDLLNDIDNDASNMDVKMLTAQVQDKDSPLRYSTTWSDRGSYNQIRELRKNYDNFWIDTIDCIIHYEEEKFNSIRLILRSQFTNYAPLSDNIGRSRSKYEQKNLYEYICTKLSNIFLESQ